YFHTEPGAITQIGFDHLAEPGGIDHDLSNSRLHQIFNMVLNNGFTADLKQRLGGGFGEGAEALAKACRQDHCFHRTNLLPSATPDTRIASAIGAAGALQTID